MGWDASRGFPPSSAVLKWLWKSSPSSRPSMQNWLLLHTCSSIGLKCSHGNKVCYLRDLSKSRRVAFILIVRPQWSWQAQVTCHHVRMQNTCSLHKDNKERSSKFCHLLCNSIDKSKFYFFFLTFTKLISLSGWDGKEMPPSILLSNKCMLDMKRSSSPSFCPDTALVYLEVWQKALNIQPAWSRNHLSEN